MDYPLPSYTEPSKCGTALAVNKVEPHPPSYSVVYIQNQTIIQEEPKPEPKKTNKLPDNYPRKHLCACEVCLNHVCCDSVYGSHCPVDCDDICDFRVYCFEDDGCFCGTLCCPMTLVIKLLCQVPCFGYNICRNRCNGTEELDYVP